MERIWIRREWKCSFYWRKQVSCWVVVLIALALLLGLSFSTLFLVVVSYFSENVNWTVFCVLHNSETVSEDDRSSNLQNVIQCSVHSYWNLVWWSWQLLLKFVWKFCSQQFFISCLYFPISQCTVVRWLFFFICKILYMNSFVS